jgi:ABC-type phosphate transport system permease subunit
MNDRIRELDKISETLTQQRLNRKLEDKKDKRELFLWFCGYVVLCIVVVWILTFLIANSLTTISEVGLKSVVEQVWCGKDANCTLPGVEQ